MIENELKTYLKKIRKNYKGKHSVKKQMLIQLEDSLLCFVEDHPDATIADIYQHFGHPDQVFLVDEPEYSNKISRRNYKLTITAYILATLTIIVILTIGVTTLRKQYINSHGYETEEILPEGVTDPAPGRTPLGVY